MTIRQQARRLNVRPGDTARVVSPGPFLGVIVIVGERYPHEVGGEPAWTFSPRLFLQDGDEQVSFFDRVLRPLGKPGDDATDETLTWPCGNPNHKPTDAETAEEHQRRVAPDYLTGQGA